MKLSLLVLFIIFSAFQLRAQTDEQINKKSKGYLKNISQHAKIRSVPIDSRYSEKTEKQLIIIDNKIYKGDDATLNQIVKDSLNLEYTIKDESSNSGVHQILIYRTKKSLLSK
jgi:hypothetical protein